MNNSHGSDWTPTRGIKALSHDTRHDSIPVALPIRASLAYGPPENSSDLERAPGARSNGDEFSGGPSIVTEIWPLKV